MFSVAAILFVLDQVTKWLIVRNLELHQVIPVIGDFFGITSHRNGGAAFGILQNQRWFFVAITLLIVVALIVYMRKNVREGNRLAAYALAFILGGALGNFIDRLLFGEVVDFLQLYFGFADYYFPNFNVADSAITIGVGLMLLDALRDGRKVK
jgi:signal peptidase II